MKKALDWFYVKLSDYHDLSLMSWHFSALKRSDQKLHALHHVVSCTLAHALYAHMCP